MKFILRAALVLLVCMGILCCFFSCTLHTEAELLSKRYRKGKTTTATPEEKAMLAAYNFTLSLYSEIQNGENQLFSPLSLLLALGMTANGAEGDTKSQMEQVFGMTTEELNHFLLAVCSTSDQNTLKLAQSMWLSEHNLNVEQSFLDVNEEYYGASIYKAPFDHTTVKDINRWVDYYTDGMIPSLLDQINPATVLYLISAMAFDGKWETPYTKNQMKEGLFVDNNGISHTVSMMHSTESVYLSHKGAVGALKYYKGGRYAFAGILPPEGMTPRDFMASLSAEDFHALLCSVNHGKADVKIPAFSLSLSQTFNEALSNMGMASAFTNEANFSKIDKTSPLSVSEIKQSTFIDVNSEGTKAAAATSVAISKTSLDPFGQVEIHLDSPFLFVILDTQTGMPILMGTMNTIE